MRADLETASTRPCGHVAELGVCRKLITWLLAAKTASGPICGAGERWYQCGPEQRVVWLAGQSLRGILQRAHEAARAGAGGPCLMAFTQRRAPSLRFGDDVTVERTAKALSDAVSLREPNLCAYAQVNSAPSKKIWAE